MTLPLLVAFSICALLASIALSWRLKSAPEQLRVKVMAAFGALLIVGGVAVLVVWQYVPIVVVAGFALVGRGIGNMMAGRSQGSGGGAA